MFWQGFWEQVKEFYDSISFQKVLNMHLLSKYLEANLKSHSNTLYVRTEVEKPKLTTTVVGGLINIIDLCSDKSFSKLNNKCRRL